MASHLPAVDGTELTRYLSELRSSPLLAVGQGFARQLGQVRWLLELQKKVSRSVENWNQVPRIQADESDRFFQDFLAANRPVVIEGLLDDWPANQNWTLEKLRERLGRHEVEYTRFFVHENRLEPEKLKAKFGDFLDLVWDENYKEPIYWTAFNQTDGDSPLAAGLEADIRFPEAFCHPPSDETRTYFWIGPEGTRSGLHFDPYNVLFAQVKGSKRMLLFPPQEIPNAYLENDYYSQVDAEAPNLALFPKFAEARPVTVEVHEGDTLLIPVGWLHQVRSLSVSISVSITSLKLANGTNSYDAPSSFRGIL